MAKSQVVGVASGLTGPSSRVEGFDRAAVFATQVIEVGDVVVSLGDKERHVVLLAKRAGPLVSGQSPWKIVQTNQANRHIAEDHGNSFHVLVRQQPLIGAFVVSDGFFKTILPVIDVADVDFQPRETPLVIDTSEYLSGAFRSLKRLIVFAKQDQRLDGSAQSTRRLFPIGKRFIQPVSLLVKFDGRPVIARGVQSVCLGAQTQSQSIFALQASSDKDGRLREVQGFLRADTDSFNDQFGKLLDSCFMNQAAMTRQELTTSGLRRELRELRGQLGSEVLSAGYNLHEKPKSSSCRRSRSMHRWRVKPMEPTASPSSLATSAYGRAGTS